MSTSTREEHHHAQPADTAQVENVGGKLRITTPLKVIIGTSFLLRVAGYATGLMLGAYLKQHVNAREDLIGFLAAIFYITELSLSPVFGALSDLRGRKAILVLGPLAGAVALPLYPLTTVFITMAVARLIEGLSTAAKVPSALGYLADATAGEGKGMAALRGRVMGLYEISFLVGLVVGNVIGGQLWGLVGVGGFYVLAALYVATAAILYFFVPESLPAEAKERHLRDREHAATSAHPVLTLFATRLKAYRKLLGEAALRSFVPAWLAVNAVVGLWAIHIQPTMIRGKGPDRFPNQLLDGKFTTSEVGLWVGAFGLCFMVGIWGWSLLYSKMRKSDMMLIAIAGLFLTCVAFWGINSGVLPLPGASREWAWVPVLAIGVLLQSGFTPVALAYLAEISGTRVEHRGAVMGLYSVFLGVGQLVGAGLGGVFLTAVDLGFNGIIIGTALLGIVALVTVIHLRRAYHV